jgi:phosphoenolpyruvate carboxykinase (GTP)
LEIPVENLTELLSVDTNGWLAEVPSIKEHFAKFGSHLPKGLQDEVAGLEQRLQKATK